MPIVNAIILLKNKFYLIVDNWNVINFDYDHTARYLIKQANKSIFNYIVCPLDYRNNFNVYYVSHYR